MKFTRLSDVFWSTSPNLYYFVIVLGLFSGLFYASLIPFILYSTELIELERVGLQIDNFNYFNSPTSYLAKIFLATCFVVILIKSLSEFLANYIANKAIMKYRIEFYKRLDRMSQLDLERIGYSKIINIMNVDIPMMVAGAIMLPLIWSNSITVVGVLSYLVYLNASVFLFILVCLLVSVFFVSATMRLSRRYFKKSRDQNDRFQEGVKGLVLGSKELKLDNKKRLRFIAEELVEPETIALKSKLKGNAIWVFTQNAGGMISFLVISVVMFHIPYVYHLTNLELFGIVIALVYLTGPIGAILNSMGPIPSGKVGLRNIREFYNTELKYEPSSQKEIDTKIEAIEVKNMSFSYPMRQNRFSLFDINARFESGEVTFIVGGNGSGKSTLSKVLSLHYPPNTGSVIYGDKEINDENIACARRNISVIYSDFYLFPCLYEDYDRELINEYMQLLSLSGIVEVNGSQFSTTKLSDGQRKRVALLALLLENRPVCIFDEWAADQDPEFKDIFYLKILPILKEQGKIVVVITHDDRYFSCADSLVEMEQGRIKRFTRNKVASITSTLEESLVEG